MSLNVPKLKDASLFRSQGYINGSWVSAKSGKTFEIKNPASGKVVGTMPEMDKEDVKDAVDAAAKAFVTYRKTTARQRARWLRNLYDLMVANADDLATLITMENGKPLYEAKNEVVYGANYIEWFSEEAPRIYGDTIPVSESDRRLFTLREPIGVVGVITPWNWPAGMPTRKIGPALAAGCTVVFKSPGETPFAACAIAELAQRAGFPPGCFNVVSAMENTVHVGEEMTSNPIIKKFSFTGSTRVGKILMAQCAKTLKKTSWELGGNPPFIVFDDAQVDIAVTGAIASKFRSSGQTCICANRIYVQQGIYEDFTKRFLTEVAKFTVGDGFDSNTTHGPLIHNRAMDKTQEIIADAQKKGAKVVAGGKKMPQLGPQFFEPTVIRDMTQEMQLANDEVFGPVAGIFPFSTEKEVIDMANNTEVGLAGYFYSSNIERCYRVAEALEVGMVGVNVGLISDVAMPFGGVKESGFGREGSKYGVDEYTVIKAITFGNMGREL